MTAPVTTPEQLAADAAATAAAETAAAEAAAAAAQEDGAGAATPTVNEHGFPSDTPLTQMSVEHQAAYWKHMSRKHEATAKNAPKADEVEALKAQLEALQAQSQTAEEKASAEAVAAAREEAAKEERARIMPLLHETQIRSYAQTVVSDPLKVNAFMAMTDASKFVGEDNLIDGAKVVESLTALFGAAPNAEAAAAAAAAAAPTNTHLNFGQGASGPSTSRKTKRGDAGLEEAKRRGFIKE